MVKKLFALASFTALTGMVVSVTAAGCSSESTTTTITDATTEKKDVTVPDAEEEDTGPSTCPDTTAITTAEIDTDIAWKPPNGIQNVCQPADIAKLQAAFDDTNNKTYADILTAISTLPAACLKCMVTDKDAANWGPLVKLDADSVLPNFGACFAAFPGSSAACGKALEYFDICIKFACRDCTTESSYDKCTGSKATQTACAEPIKKFQTDCAVVSTALQDNNSPLSKACNDLINATSTLCAGGAFDGGTVDAAGQ